MSSLLPQLLDGALLIDKPKEHSSFEVIQNLQNALIQHQGYTRKTLPKMGHGGTLDPFATGLLVVFIGNGVKLSRYFLDSVKKYQATVCFGKTTLSGDPTNPISQTHDHLPASLNTLQDLAHKMTLQNYLQTPPMFSAKKHEGKKLYELAREGIEIEREPVSCKLYEFLIHSYDSPFSTISVSCSAGTYIRTLAQDFAQLLGTVGMLTELRRTHSGNLSLENSLSLSQVLKAISEGTPPPQLKNFVSFSNLLNHFPSVSANSEQARAITQGKQEVLGPLSKKIEDLKSSSHRFVIYYQDSLLAVAALNATQWKLERVFWEPNSPIG